MADLYDLLTPHLDPPDNPSRYRSSRDAISVREDANTISYLNRLTTLSLADLTSTEASSLQHATQTHIRNLQALSKRSHKTIVAAATCLQPLKDTVPAVEKRTDELKNLLPTLESAAAKFAQKYDRTVDNEVLERRRKALLLSHNTDRLYDILDLPSLLSSSVLVAQNSTSGTTSTGTSIATSFASALDLHAQIKRLAALYPNSKLTAGLVAQSESEIAELTTILMTTLQSPSLKLAAAMRTIGLLRRVAPDLAGHGHKDGRTSMSGSKRRNLGVEARLDDGALGSTFLVCRLYTLKTTLDALEPLRDLADSEKATMRSGARSSAAVGVLSERYLKRYIEVFREQSFNIISMYKSIFPDDLPQPSLRADADEPFFASTKPVRPSSTPSLPSALSSFSLYLVDMFTSVLREYLPNIIDKPARESLLTQVLFCAGSLGRLGADFGLVIALLEAESSLVHDGDDGSIDEAGWVQVMYKHRIQAGRLEALARGVGTGVKVTTIASSNLNASMASS